MASNTAAMVEAEVNLEYSQSAAAPFNLPRGREMTYDGNHCSHQSRHCHQHSHTHRHLSCVYGAPDLLWHAERKDVKPKVKVAEERKDLEPITPDQIRIIVMSANVAEKIAMNDKCVNHNGITSFSS